MDREIGVSDAPTAVPRGTIGDATPLDRSVVVYGFGLVLIAGGPLGAGNAGRFRPKIGTAYLAANLRPGLWCVVSPDWLLAHKVRDRSGRHGQLRRVLALRRGGDAVARGGCVRRILDRVAMGARRRRAIVSSLPRRSGSESFAAPASTAASSSGQPSWRTLVAEMTSRNEDRRRLPGRKFAARSVRRGARRPGGRPAGLRS